MSRPSDSHDYFAAVNTDCVTVQPKIWHSGKGSDDGGHVLPDRQPSGRVLGKRLTSLSNMPRNLEKCGGASYSRTD